MAEGVRIVADCDGFAVPWEGGARLYSFGQGTVLLLLRQDDPRFLKVAYDGQPLFVPRSACVDVEVTSSSQLSGPGAERLELEGDRPPARPWRVSEVVGIAVLLVMLPILAYFSIFAAFLLRSASAAVLLWCLVAFASSLFVARLTSQRAALWGGLGGGLLTYGLVALIVDALSEI